MYTQIQNGAFVDLDLNHYLEYSDGVVAYDAETGSDAPVYLKYTNQELRRYDARKMGGVYSPVAQYSIYNHSTRRWEQPTHHDKMDKTIPRKIDELSPDEKERLNAARHPKPAIASSRLDYSSASIINQNEQEGAGGGAASGTSNAKNKSTGKGKKTILGGKAYEAVQVMSSFLSPNDARNFKSISREQHSIFYPNPQEKISKITSKLLLAVAYGMQDINSSYTISKEDTEGLFKHNLFALDLLVICPEYLLERSDVTDFAGRTFQNITAFEYAVWAKDFKMIEMMLSCLPNTPEGNEIRTQLLDQMQHVRAPIGNGGGLTYTLTYDAPILDANGIPLGAIGSWQSERVTREQTENHFDITPLLEAYQNLLGRLGNLNRHQFDTIRIRIIGGLQHLLPVHILQRLCSDLQYRYHDTNFEGGFERGIDIYNSAHGSLRAPRLSIFSPGLSTEYVILGPYGSYAFDLELRIVINALRRLNETSTRRLNNIIEVLESSFHAGGPQASAQ